MSSLDDVLSSQFTPQTAAEYEAAMDQLLAEIQRLNQQMKEDQSAIDRLKTETETLKRETRALLASMGVPL
jgi:peptidoglycan hydrolase CwlO-like protein